MVGDKDEWWGTQGTHSYRECPHVPATMWLFLSPLSLLGKKEKEKKKRRKRPLHPIGWHGTSHPFLACNP